MEENNNTFWPMKHKCFGLLFFLCVLVSCSQMPNESNETKEMEILYRTYHIDSKSITHPLTYFSLESSAKYHGQYFCLFREDPFCNGYSYYNIIVIQPSDSTLYEISRLEARTDTIYSVEELLSNGLVETKTAGNVYGFPHLFVHNDSLFIEGYDAEKSCYIIDSVCSDDGSSCWKLKKTLPPSPIVFEDDDYCVKFTNEGLNGQYLSFIDKSDSKEHIFRCWGKVFKRNDGYYLCSNTAISRITNPKEGIVHPAGKYYPGTPASDPEILYYPSNPDIMLNAFFMHNDSIYMLETCKDSTYLSKFDEQGILRIKKLEQKISYIFSSSLDNNYFSPGDTYYFVNKVQNREEHYGIIDIDGNQMTIINLIPNLACGNMYNIDALKELSKEKGKYEIHASTLLLMLASRNRLFLEPEKVIQGGQFYYVK